MGLYYIRTTQGAAQAGFGATNMGLDDAIIVVEGLKKEQRSCAGFAQCPHVNESRSENTIVDLNT